MKPIRLSAHALGYSERRGFTVDEVEQAIRTRGWEPSISGRLECHMEFAYDRYWNGRHYREKQVRPVFVDEENEIVVITIYTYDS